MIKKITDWKYLPWALFTIGAALRCVDLTRSPLWYDESYTRILTGLPLARMLAATAGDTHPPLYFLIVWGLAHLFGNTALVLRGFSVVCSILALPVIWHLSGLMGLARPARLIALGLMVVWPVQVYYAQEARMYTLFQLLVLLQLVMFYGRRWVGLALITTLTIYSHNYGLFYTAALGLIGLVQYRHNRRDLMHLLSSIAVPGVAWLPWFGVLINQMQNIYGGHWIPPVTLGSVVYAVYEILAGFSVPDQLIPVTVLSLAAGVTLLVITGIQQRKGALLALAVVPLALALAISLAWQPMLLFRGLMPSLPALAFLAGITLARSGLRGWLIGLVLLAPIAIALGAQMQTNHIGMVKGVPIWYPVGTPRVHLEETTMVLSGASGDDYLLMDCPNEAGALSQQTRTAIGYKWVTLDDLPDDYYLAGMLTPLATKCHEDVFERLTASAYPVYVDRGDLGIWGVWHHALR